MTIIDRYIARTFLGGYVILVLVGISLYILTDLLINIDEFTKDPALSFAQVLGHMADYYGYNLPLYYSQLGGPMMAIAAAFTLGMMLRNNEMAALVASGMPLQRLAAPLAVASIFLVALWTANRELVIPRIAAEIARDHDDIVGQRTYGVHCVRDERGTILTALRLYPRDGALYRAFFVEADAQGNPTSLVEADQARYAPDRGTWVLERGRRMLIGEPAGAGELGASIRYESVHEYSYGLTPAELVLRQGAQWADLLSLRQMNALVRGGKLPNQAMIVMTRHVRLTQPLFQWILLLLALPFFLTREPANVIAAGGRALLLTGLFFGVAFVAHTAVQETWAALVAWVPILLFGPFAVLQLANVKT